VTKYILLIIGTALFVGSFAALLLYPDVRHHLQQRPGPFLQLIVWICFGCSIYLWASRRWK
jgi:hypothetical protein